MKSRQVTEFLAGLHEFIVNDPRLPKHTATNSESEAHAELRPIIAGYLEAYFAERGYKRPAAKAERSLYWEGQPGAFGTARAPVFATRNYPDFIITAPYSIAIEYKQSPSGARIKQGLGQSIMHTLIGDFDYVCFLFRDENTDKRIENSAQGQPEAAIVKKMWDSFNVLVKFI